jgi:hypothetical protein
VVDFQQEEHAMSKITLTPELKALLAGATGRVELCDENGNPLGYFEPTEPRGKFWPFTDEEVEEARQARKRNEPGRTLDEILKEAGLL